MFYLIMFLPCGKCVNWEIVEECKLVGWRASISKNFWWIHDLVNEAKKLESQWSALNEETYVMKNLRTSRWIENRQKFYIFIIFTKLFYYFPNFERQKQTNEYFSEKNTKFYKNSVTCREICSILVSIECSYLSQFEKIKTTQWK